MRAAALPLTLALTLALGCDRSEQSPGPGPVETPPTPEPAPVAVGGAEAVAVGGAVAVAVDRATLAAAGYYGLEEATAAWTQNHRTCAGVTDGDELLGRRLPEWSLTDWRNGEPRTLESLRGRVVVVRFWTSPGCPFCEKTLPVLEALSKELASEPVTFIGAFHAKPMASTTSMDDPARVASDWKVSFPIALDPEWSTLKSWWLADNAHRHATSVTYVIGKDGAVLFIHPGPVFHPSDDPAEAKQNTDYLAVRAAIDRGIKAR